MNDITRADFGHYAGNVQDFGGELILPVGDSYEIHPAAEAGRWAVVNHRSGHVAATYDDIEDAVSHAESAETLAANQR